MYIYTHTYIIRSYCISTVHDKNKGMFYMHLCLLNHCQINGDVIGDVHRSAPRIKQIKMNNNNSQIRSVVQVGARVITIKVGHHLGKCQLIWYSAKISVAAHGHSKNTCKRSNTSRCSDSKWPQILDNCYYLVLNRT